jgi:putative ABC transport system substrate-binding protein
MTKSEEIADAIDAAKNSSATALNVLASLLLYNNRQIILTRATALALPAIYQWSTVAAEGALIGCGPRLEQIYGDIFSRQFVKLLRGVAVVDIPVEQPTKFELAVNLKTAKMLAKGHCHRAKRCPFMGKERSRKIGGYPLMPQIGGTLA